MASSRCSLSRGLLVQKGWLLKQPCEHSAASRKGQPDYIQGKKNTHFFVFEAKDLWIFLFPEVEIRKV